jgi:hypothetical protein
MATLNAKQKVIKNAYGEYWEKVKDYVDENGFINTYSTKISPHSLKYSWVDIEVSKKWIDDKIGDTICFRPKSLQGIENNNGWIKIESEADLPKEGMHHSILLDSECINGYRNYDVIVFYEVNSKFRKKEISHYQPIEKPLKPLY